MIFVVGVMIMKRKHNNYNKTNVRIVSHTALQIEFRLFRIVALSICLGDCYYICEHIFVGCVHVIVLCKHTVMDSIFFKLEIDLNEEGI